jgi:hypothetical protein
MRCGRACNDARRSRPDVEAIDRAPRAEFPAIDASLETYDARGKTLDCVIAMRCCITSAISTVLAALDRVFQRVSYADHAYFDEGRGDDRLGFTYLGTPR